MPSTFTVPRKPLAIESTRSTLRIFEPSPPTAFRTKSPLRHRTIARSIVEGWRHVVAPKGVTWSRYPGRDVEPRKGTYGRPKGSRRKTRSNPRSDGHDD